MELTIPFIQERSFKNKFCKIITEEIINIRYAKMHTHTINLLEAIGRMYLSMITKETKEERIKILVIKAMKFKKNSFVFNF